MRILYQDDRIIVCVKPAGVLSTDEPGGMPELLRRSLGSENAVIRSVHRLDRTAGGVMVYARTRRAAADLSRQITDGRFRKYYLAVVHGTPEKPEDEYRDWIHRDKKERKSYMVPAGTADAQEAILAYRTLASAEEMSLMSIRLQTGRTHQIRCQLSTRGNPIVGDRKYGSATDECDMALWSYKLEFFHPRTEEKMTYMQDVPEIYPWNRFGADFIGV